MNALEDFPAAFAALTDTPGPLPWQSALHESLCEGIVPTALDLPTGLGKTSVIALWLLARAAGSRVPRRLFVVVNNRAVVDQATVVAERLADVLDTGAPEWLERDDRERGLLSAIRAGLGLSDEERLPVSTLRGQRADNRAWLQNPAAPAIIVGTVDMVGSRLLFSGYTVSRWSRSIHAGLLGTDSLIVLDESHLVPPFAHLLRASEERATANFAPVRSLVPDGIAPLRTMFLSATGRGRAENVFGLTEADLANDWVRRRLHAPKRLRVIEVAEKELVDAMASRAVELAAGRERVVVFSTSFKRAHAIADAIEKLIRKAGDADGSPVVVRLTGQIRVRERSALERDPVFRRFAPDGGECSSDAPAFLVATAAGEVGIDVDADHMVADVAPFERQVQRLGRVNRTGRERPAIVDVFAARPSRAKDADSFERWLAPLVHEAWPVEMDDRRDASPAALSRLKDDPVFRVVREAAESEEPFRPPLTEALLDAWSMTSLAVHPARPVVRPWLHGWEEDEAEVTILWRRHLPGRDHVASYLEDAPPHLLETLSVPLGTAESWLAAVVRREGRSRSDEGQRAAGASDPARGSSPVAAILSRRDEAMVFDTATLERRIEATSGRPEQFLRGGDTLILDAAYGGLRRHGVLDAKWAEPPRVWDDVGSIPSGAVMGDRIGEEGELPDEGATASAEDTSGEPGPSELVEPFDAIPRRWREGRTRAAITDDGYRPGRYRESFEELSDASGGEPVVRVRWIDVAVRGGGSTDTRGERGLDEHHEDVADVVRARCAALGLDGALREALVEAARHHDLGKSRALWQRAADAPSKDAPLAKTGRPMNGKLLGGYRHEFGSVSDAKGSSDMEALEASVRDLALHLVASHHGRARPWIEPLDPDVTPPLTVDEADASDLLAEEIARRFDRLQACFGHWVLGWLEALLRTSDWEASRRVDEPGNDIGRPSR